MLMQLILTPETGTPARPGPYAPPSVTGSPAYARIIHDADFLIQRFRRFCDPRKALGSTDDMYSTVDELCELLISVAATASLVGYRHEGDDWRLEVVGPHSAHGLQLLGYLHDLRAELQCAESDVRRMFQSGKVRLHMKRCIALAALALDAVSSRHLPDFMTFAGISRDSQDPVGDAQFAAEQHDAAGAIPLLNA